MSGRPAVAIAMSNDELAELEMRARRRKTGILAAIGRFCRRTLSARYGAREIRNLRGSATKRPPTLLLREWDSGECQGPVATSDGAG